MCNGFFASIEKAFPVTAFHVDFLKGKPIFQLSGLLTSNGVRGILKGKAYQCIKMVFLFNFSNVDKATGYIQDTELNKVHTMYSGLLLEFFPKNIKKEQVF